MGTFKDRVQHEYVSLSMKIKEMSLTEEMVSKKDGYRQRSDGGWQMRWCAEKITFEFSFLFFFFQKGNRV